MSTETSSHHPGVERVRKRKRADQGDGQRLRDELVDATIAVLSETRSVDQVSLRSVARRVGVAAPSIYLHFADRDALLIAALMTAHERFALALESADRRAGADLRKRMQSVGRAYLRFAVEQPGCYVVLFAGVLPAAMLAPPHTAENLPSSFAVLHRLCAAIVATGTGSGGVGPGGSESKVAAAPDLPRSASAHNAKRAMALALQAWAALHGVVTLRTAQPGFPWPTDAVVVADLEALLFVDLG